VATSIDWPSTRVTIAFLTSLLRAERAAEPLHLALADQGVDALTLTPNSASTAALICGFVASSRR
jgi:hypothetical protein